MRHRGAGNGLRKVVCQIFLALVVGCASAEQLPRQPIHLPFTAAQKGTVLTTDFQATEDNTYWFSLGIGFATNDDRKDMSRVEKLMGDGSYDPKAKKRLNNGLPIPLKLTIHRLDPSGASLLYDKEIFELELEGGGAKFYSKIIDKIRLSPGNYRVRVEALRDIPELAETPIDFAIYIRRF